MENILVVTIVLVSALVAFRPLLAGLRRRRQSVAAQAPSCGTSCAGCSCSFVRRSSVPGVAVVALLFLATTPVQALDTVETFDVGPTDVEAYLGYGGMGVGPADREVSSELMLGYGLTGSFSAYLATCTAVAEQTFQGQTALCAGLLGTPVNTDHFDLDLMLDFEASGDALGELGLAPGLELNYDRAPDMSSWGVYARAGIATYGLHDGASSVRRVADLALNPGAYLRVSPRVELLAEYDHVVLFGSDRDPADQARGLALGVNAMVSSSIELITGLHRTLPTDGGDSPWGLTLGFIATLPSGG